MWGNWGLGWVRDAIAPLVGGEGPAPALPPAPHASPGSNDGSASSARGSSRATSAQRLSWMDIQMVESVDDLVETCAAHDWTTPIESNPFFAEYLTACGHVTLCERSQDWQIRTPPATAGTTYWNGACLVPQIPRCTAVAAVRVGSPVDGCGLQRDAQLALLATCTRGNALLQSLCEGGTLEDCALFVNFVRRGASPSQLWGFDLSGCRTVTDQLVVDLVHASLARCGLHDEPRRGDGGISPDAAALTASHMRNLDLRGTRVTDACIPYMVTLAATQPGVSHRLTFDTTSVSWEALRPLRRLRNVRLEWVTWPP